MNVIHHKNTYIKTLFVLFFLGFSLFAKAQVYPVQVIPNLSPPYNVTLPSYTTTTSDKINVRLILTDVGANVDVRLKMIIKGQGLNIQSTDFVVGAAPINLTGGAQKLISTIDLQPYFRLQNLVGVPPQVYNRPLPAGRYDFCFQVWTTNTQNPQLISNPNGGCAFAFLVLNDPPILIKPQRGDQIVLKDPLNIFFNWQSRSTTATNLSYEFEIRELWDDQLDPQAVFLASPPLYRETTRANAFLYDNTKPALLPDKTYAWRVRAISTSGIDENAVYKNNGYSEIFHFRLTKDCNAPKFPLSEAISKSTVKINWQGNLEHNKYHVQYRKVSYTQETDKQKARREKKNKKRVKKGQKEKDYVSKKEDHDWFEVYTFNEQAQISNLEAGVTYEFRVGGTCSSLASLNHYYYSYTSENQFTMPTDEETVSYNCGVVPNIQITNQIPLQNIGVNESFMAGDFTVTVKEVQGSGGRFSGNGFIVVPYLADTKLAVAFEGITINTDYQLIDGVVKTTYDPNWGDVEDIDDLLGGGSGEVKEITIEFPIDYPDGIQIDPNGDILIISPDGAVIEIAGGKDTIITDGSSPPKQYAIDEEGNVTPLGEVAKGGKPTPENTNGVNSDGEATELTAEGVSVTFSAIEQGTYQTKYGFDGYNSQYPKTKELYNELMYLIKQLKMVRQII